MARVRHAAVGIVAAVAILSGCRGSGPSLGDLKKMPEATLRYRGSTELSRNETDAETNVYAKNPASLDVFRCAVATSSDILAWFDHELRGDGWAGRPDQNDFMPGSGYDGPTHSWAKGKFSYLLRFVAADRAAELTSEHGTNCSGTAYETFLLAAPA